MRQAHGFFHTFLTLAGRTGTVLLLVPAFSHPKDHPLAVPLRRRLPRRTTPLTAATLPYPPPCRRLLPPPRPSPPDPFILLALSLSGLGRSGRAAGHPTPTVLPEPWLVAFPPLDRLIPRTPSPPGPGRPPSLRVAAGICHTGNETPC